MSEIDVVKFAGILYGDGYLSKGGSLCFHHSVIQQEYAEYKAKYCLENFGLKSSKKIIKKRENSFSTNDGIHFSFCVKNWTKELRNQWYDDSGKSVPASILELFGWEQWAFLYQDDGRQNKIGHVNSMASGVRTRVEMPPSVNRYEICLGYSTDEELEALMKSLSSLGVGSSILVRKDGQRNLSISRAKDKITFYENILPLLHPSMLYKMNVPPTFRYGM